MFNWNEIIKGNAPLSLIEILEMEIREFLQSKRRREALEGERYYRGEHDILQTERTMIDGNGNTRVISNLPNYREVDNQYAKLVDQKINYLLSKPFEVASDNNAYVEVFNKAFRRKLQLIGKDMLNASVGFLYVYVDEGNVAFKRFKPSESLPIWEDDEHDELQLFLHVRDVQEFEGRSLKTKVFVDVYSNTGVDFYTFENEHLRPRDVGQTYLVVDNKPYNWGKLPVIPFKYNEEEVTLLRRVKSLQDALNKILSNFMNNMEEDIRNTVLVIENYDGTELGDFRRNLAAYGVIKVRNIEGARGGVNTLSIDVNADNYNLIITLLKRAIIDNGRGFDAKDERMANNPNQMNIQSMYADIDIDADGMELQLQTSLEKLMYFVNTYLHIKGIAPSKVDFIFNRDILINESEAITNCQNSVGVISTETIVANHPWTTNTKEELERLKDGEEYPIPKVDDGDE